MAKIVKTAKVAKMPKITQFHLRKKQLYILKKITTFFSLHSGMISNCPIPPKTSFTYIFRVNGEPGTYFYHGHLGGIRAAGLYGMVIIDPVSGTSEQWNYDGEHTLLLSDWYHAIQHELTIGLLEEEFRWTGTRARLGSASDFRVL